MCPPDRADIIRGAPYFPVPDVSSIGAYYRDVLGFRCEYAAGEPPEFAVYSRGNDPCRRCGTPIRYRKQGEDARGTYWCPKCQR